MTPKGPQMDGLGGSPFEESSPSASLPANPTCPFTCNDILWSCGYVSSGEGTGVKPGSSVWRRRSGSCEATRDGFHGCDPGRDNLPFMSHSFPGPSEPDRPQGDMKQLMYLGPPRLVVAEASSAHMAHGTVGPQPP